MRTPDYFDRYDADESDGEDGIVCKRCGATGLYWQTVVCADGKSERHSLFAESTRKAHVCQVRDDFEVVK